MVTAIQAFAPLLVQRDRQARCRSVRGRDGDGSRSTGRDLRGPGFNGSPANVATVKRSIIVVCAQFQIQVIHGLLR
jgi:hypothetical protein